MEDPAEVEQKRKTTWFSGFYFGIILGLVVGAIVGWIYCLFSYLPHAALAF